MLKTVENSQATKTRGIAVTYRAGERAAYGTCPLSCEMNCSGTGSQKINAEYFAALLSAVPRRGKAFTYSHFAWPLWSHLSNKTTTGQTVVNYSAKTLASAAMASHVVPSVVVLAPDQWKNGKHTAADSGERVVRCPAEYIDRLSCADCGNGRPLCARSDRTFIVGFTAHGASKRKAADPDTRGGCYANGGHVRLHWDATANGNQLGESDADKLSRFAAGLRAGSILRHHVAGDIG